MPRYIALIDGEPGAYGATFPDRPGCTAMSETMDEAIRNAGDALREWIGDRLSAGLSAPEPRSVDVLLSDPDQVEGYAPLSTLLTSRIARSPALHTLAQGPLPEFVGCVEMRNPEEEPQAIAAGLVCRRRGWASDVPQAAKP